MTDRSPDGRFPNGHFYSPVLDPREVEADAARIRAMVANPALLRDALIAREILGPPPGLKRLQRRR